MRRRTRTSSWTDALAFTHTAPHTYQHTNTDWRTGSSNRGPWRTVVSSGTLWGLGQACLVTQSASLTLNTWRCTSTLWRIYRQGNNLEYGFISLSNFNSTLSVKLHLVFCMDYVLPAEKYQEDTVVPWRPPPRYNNPPLLHSEQARLSHQYNRNQEYKGLKVRCC